MTPYRNLIKWLLTVILELQEIMSRQPRARTATLDQLAPGAVPAPRDVVRALRQRGYVIAMNYSLQVGADEAIATCRFFWWRGALAESLPACKEDRGAPIFARYVPASHAIVYSADTANLDDAPLDFPQMGSALRECIMSLSADGTA